MDALQMVDPHGALPNVGLDAALVDEFGGPMGNRAPRRRRINVEKFEPLAPGEKRTISFSLNPLSLFTSGYLLPLMHASIAIELLLVTSPRDVVVSDQPAELGANILRRRRSERWQINEPKLTYSSNTLSSAAQGELTGLALKREAEKAMYIPSQAITKPGDTPGCGKLLKPVLPPLVGNCEWGPRLIAVA